MIIPLALILFIHYSILVCIIKKSTNSECKTVNGLHNINVMLPMSVLHLIAHTRPVIDLALTLFADEAHSYYHQNYRASQFEII